MALDLLQEHAYLIPSRAPVRSELDALSARTHEGVQYTYLPRVLGCSSIDWGGWICVYGTYYMNASQVTPVTTRRLQLPTTYPQYLSIWMMDQLDDVLQAWVASISIDRLVNLDFDLSYADMTGVLEAFDIIEAVGRNLKALRLVVDRPDAVQATDLAPQEEALRARGRGRTPLTLPRLRALGHWLDQGRTSVFVMLQILRACAPDQLTDLHLWTPGTIGSILPSRYSPLHAILHQYGKGLRRLKLCYRGGAYQQDDLICTELSTSGDTETTLPYLCPRVEIVGLDSLTGAWRETVAYLAANVQALRIDCDLLRETEMEEILAGLQDGKKVKSVYLWNSRWHRRRNMEMFRRMHHWMELNGFKYAGLSLCQSVKLFVRQGVTAK